MRLVCISDTHSLHDQIPKIPDGDILVHAGDCTASGRLSQLEQFTDWMGRLPHKHKVLIAGNHDYCFERDPESSREMCNKRGVIYLQDQSVVIDSLSLYGFPWQPIFRHMAFNAPERELEERLRNVPDNTHVLISHGPALRIFDFIPAENAHVGCYALAQRIEQLPSLKAHICGHIHESYGYAVRESDGLKFANASTCTEKYKPTNPPIIIDL